MNPKEKLERALIIGVSCMLLTGAAWLLGRWSWNQMFSIFILLFLNNISQNKELHNG